MLACEAQAELGQAGITKEEAQWIRDHADFTVERIDEIEKVTNHDVIAFTTCMAEHIDADVPEGQEKPSRWVHYGMTSSDLGDTALSYQIVQAIDIILDDVKQLRAKRRAFEFQNTLCVGRTHGIHAEPMTFGMKFGSWAWALKRAQTRLEQAREVAATGAISGAVGTYSSIDPYVEKYVCEKLGLTPDPLSTQVLARDRHAQVMCALACAAATLESIAMQVRLLQQTDVIEAEEPFKKGQKGSSAMPHKRNPITAERVCGLARCVKANAQVALDNVALWYERDISHSGTERVALADSFTALDYMFAKMQWIADGLQTYPAKMETTCGTKGLIISSKVLVSGEHGHHARGGVRHRAAQRHGRGRISRTRWTAPRIASARRAIPRPSCPRRRSTRFDPWDFLTRKDECSGAWRASSSKRHCTRLRRPSCRLPVKAGAVRAYRRWLEACVMAGRLFERP